MAKVTFLPLDLQVESQPKETLLDVALRHDIPIQHACGGFCACTTCHVHVKEGAESLSPMEDEENERIEGVDRFSLNSRLACQAQIRGDVVVEIMNLDD